MKPIWLKSLNKRSKYNNIKTKIDEILFDSQKEAGRYLELKMLLKAKEIKDLRLQPQFMLQDGFTDQQGRKHRPISYVGDFEYIKDGKRVVEDVKGQKTNEYKLKKKLFLFKFKDYLFYEI